MSLDILKGLLIPFIGTSTGAACVFLMKGQLNAVVEKILTGFAAGVMVAASVWSLLIPAMEQSSGMGRMAFLPSAIGFSLGTAFLLLLDTLIPHLHMNSKEPEGIPSTLKKNTMMVLAVTLHNIPEGMAVGVVFAAWADRAGSISFGAALALAVGIAIQNFPEGAIISMPLAAEGTSKGRAFLYGVISGAVEPLGAVLTVMAAGLIVPFMPYMLSFAAGAMMYVVVEELIPEMSRGKHSNKATVFFTLGFVLMMILDVALG